MNNSASVRTTRGTASQIQKASAAPAVFCCNRCERPLATSLFVCGCFCVFCEECTIDHFQNSHNCPSCGRALTEKDFMDLVITDPSPAAVATDSVKSAFQKIFTKKTSSSQYLPYADMTSQFLKQLNDLVMAGKFLLKHLVESSNRQGEDKGSLGRSNELLQQENIQLKQSQNAARLELQKTIEDLDHQLQARNGTIVDLQMQLEEKENILDKFRKLHGNTVMVSPSHGAGPVSTSTTIPVSSHSSVYHNHRHHGAAALQQQQMPLQGYMTKCAAEERAKQQVLQSHLDRGGVVLGRNSTISVGSHQSNNNNNNMSSSSMPPTGGITPIQVPHRRPLFTAAANPYQQQHQHQQQQRQQESPGASLNPRISRIRDFTSSSASSTSGFAFTGGRSNHNHHHHHPVDQRHHSSSSNDRRTPPPPTSRSGNNKNYNNNSVVSPTMAFARNHQGSGRFGSNHGIV